MSHANIKYAGATPGNDSNDYILLVTALPAGTTDTMNAQWPENFCALANIKKLSVVIKCDNAGTLKFYESVNRGTTFRQIDQISVAAPGSTASFVAEFLVEGLRDFKLVWTNGGSAQTFFDVLMSLSEQRASAV
jgi:hypothetical protein